MSLRSRSPVFFTGCTNEANVCDISLPLKELSPEDYKNFSDALESLFKCSKQPALCPAACPAEQKRPYLLPLPPSLPQTTTNGSEKPSDVLTSNCGSLSSVASIEAEVHLNQKHHEVPSMGDDTMSVKNSSPNTSFQSNSSFESPRHDRGNKRKFSVPTSSPSRAGFHTPPPLHPNFYESPRPETSQFYNNSPQQYYQFQNFKSFRSPSYSEVPNLNRRSGPPMPYKKRRTLSPERRVPHTVKENTFFQMSDVMWQLYYNNRQSPEEQNHKFALRNQLQQILKETFPYCGLYIVGSTMNGMGTKNCDMDLCLMLSHSEIDQGKEAIKILERVSRVLSKCRFVSKRSVIHAKVPILKFRDTIRGIDVDLNINNAVGIRNTQLLNSYSRIDNRVSPLVILIKLWARMYDINDAKENTLSSYSLALMIIHYLQFACKPPVVPCLQQIQPEKYHPESDVRELKLEEDMPPFVSQNSQSLGELFYGFLDYYTNAFAFSESVISVRTGGIISRDCAINVASPKNKKAHWKFISIEEPFDLTNTARSVFNEEVFRYIIRVFFKSWDILNGTMDINRIIDVEKLLEQRR